MSTQLRLIRERLPSTEEIRSLERKARAERSAAFHRAISSILNDVKAAFVKRRPVSLAKTSLIRGECA